MVRRSALSLDDLLEAIIAFTADLHADKPSPVAADEPSRRPDISSVARYTGVTTPETTANGPDGELVGGVALASGTDRAGAWLAFDGTGYVQLTDASDFLKVAATKRTIEMWVKATSTSGTQVLFESGDSTNGFGLKIDAGTLVFGVTSGGTPKTVSATYTSTDWHKVTAVYDGSTTNGTMTLYVDGSSVATDANVGFNSVGTTTDGAALGGTLGSDAFGGSTTGGSFTGSIDAVRVMNDAVAPLAMAVENTTYTYNERNQLVTEAITGGTTKTYYYNRNGENTEKDPDPQSQDYNVAIEEKSGQTVVSTERKEYDDFGRMTKWSKTDATGTVTEEHTYRGAGWERASTKVNGGDETRYLYDGDNVVGDLVGGAFTRQYVTPFLDENLSMTVQGETPATYFYSRDGLGSVRTLTDASQVVQNRYAYSAFGESYAPGTTVGVAQRYTFQGREASAVGGPMAYRNRSYSASLGRFGRRDFGLDGGNQFNFYAAMGGNAVNYWDPMGLELTGAARLEAEAQLSVYISRGNVPAFYRPINDADVDTVSANKGSDETLLRGKLWRSETVIGTRWYLACDDALIAEKQRILAEAAKIGQENRAIAAAWERARQAEIDKVLFELKVQKWSAIGVSGVSLAAAAAPLAAESGVVVLTETGQTFLQGGRVAGQAIVQGGRAVGQAIAKEAALDAQVVRGWLQPIMQSRLAWWAATTETGQATVGVGIGLVRGFFRQATANPLAPPQLYAPPPTNPSMPLMSPMVTGEWLGRLGGMTAREATTPDTPRR